MKEKISLAAGPPHRARRAGLRRSAARRPIRPPPSRRVLARIGLLQIDSVSAVVRAHYMPLFSRLGPYPLALLDDAAVGRKRAAVRILGARGLAAAGRDLAADALAHGSAPSADDEHVSRAGEVGRANTPAISRRSIAQVVERRPDRRLRHRRPQGLRRLVGLERRQSTPSNGCSGPGASPPHSRRGFERLYDLPERVLPAGDPRPAGARRRRRAPRIAAHFGPRARRRHRRRPARLFPAVARRHEGPDRGTGRGRRTAAGRGRRLDAAGLSAPDARLPRKVEARALLAPFDPLVFERSRTERLFDFRYRIEIYTPAEKRQYGYYVLPFLLGDRIVARVDLKADRPAGVLRVLAAYAEPGAPPETAAELFDELG